MSDLNVIIPLAIVLAVALMAGGGGGGSAPEEPDDRPDEYRFTPLHEQPGFGLRHPRRHSMSSVTTTRTEQRFVADKQTWEDTPRALPDKATELLTEVYSEQKKLIEAREKAQSLQTRESGEELSAQLGRYMEYYQGFGNASVNNLYVLELQTNIEELTKSLDEHPGSDYEWKGGGQQLSTANRTQLISVFLDLKHELSTYDDRINHEIEVCKTVIEALVDPTESNVLFDQRTQVSDIDGYAVSENQSFVGKVIGVHDTPQYAKSEDLRPDISMEENLLKGVPEVPEPDTYFHKPTKSVEPIMKRIAEHHVMQDHPSTPPRKPSSKHRGSPSFDRLSKQVQRIASTKSDFDQAPPTPAFGAEPEDEDFSSDEDVDQLSLYSKLSLDADSSSIINDSATKSQAQDLTSFLKEAGKRDIDTSVSRGLINQGRTTKDRRALDTIEKNLRESNKKIRDEVKKYPSRLVTQPWKIKPKQLEFATHTPFKTARTTITAQTRFKDAIRTAVKNTRTLAASRNISQLEEQLERLKALAPEGFRDGSWYDALTSQENVKASNGKTVLYSDLSKEDMFKRYSGAVHSLQESISRFE